MIYTESWPRQNAFFCCELTHVRNFPAWPNVQIGDIEDTMADLGWRWR